MSVEPFVPEVPTVFVTDGIDLTDPVGIEKDTVLLTPDDPQAATKNPAGPSFTDLSFPTNDGHLGV